ncbi:hypothetical protein HP570_18300 [Brevibacillus sp. RS1.1]|uniref:hypothetical protein n=2 Tax=Brevibacillus TaxID=55080 RepID=UPI00156AE65E|nr:hypothetical protein [Brevibacillus sp. RS1.1]NRR04175.1 hypothetical protein [Brevibacillus sp. RS1.1]
MKKTSIHAGYAPGKSTKNKVVDYVKSNLRDTGGAVTSVAKNSIGNVLFGKQYHIELTTKRRAMLVS